MTTRRREQPLNSEPPRASRIAAKVADEIQSATLEWISPRLFYSFNFLTYGSPMTGASAGTGSSTIGASAGTGGSIPGLSGTALFDGGGMAATAPATCAASATASPPMAFCGQPSAVSRRRASTSRTAPPALPPPYDAADDNAIGEHVEVVITPFSGWAGDRGAL